ncbi:MAG: FKBP-type peptidyl-prolyl cis-trans isomerase [Gammaproteobacteria bacterium]|jgi:FKBP-type peptidyl-prolyl cis-trans isomerase FklB|nr:FKBP-type peptidyl-prolyl cis-trans isomerase [Gammaproteobacteria bacterium]MBT6949996.1 FKBP-type peptidyl-prolyl cis-trans isomerase [Gammaproteobacteria bacterium]
MNQKLIPVALLLLAGCSETQETSQPEVAQEQQQSQEMQASQSVSQPEVAAEAILAEQELIQQELIQHDPGQAYLYINAQKSGVKVMPSGLQFEIIESGEGRSPLATSNVVTHYHGTFVNGDVFDSSVDRGAPAEFPVNRVIAGWTEALQMMKEGDKWRLVLPPEIAYGERGAAGGLIPPNTVLVFEVELIEVKG